MTIPSINIMGDKTDVLKQPLNIADFAHPKGYSARIDFNEQWMDSLNLPTKLEDWVFEHMNCNDSFYGTRIGTGVDGDKPLVFTIHRTDNGFRANFELYSGHIMLVASGTIDVFDTISGQKIYEFFRIQNGEQNCKREWILAKALLVEDIFVYHNHIPASRAKLLEVIRHIGDGALKAPTCACAFEIQNALENADLAKLTNLYQYLVSLIPRGYRFLSQPLLTIKNQTSFENGVYAILKGIATFPDDFGDVDECQTSPPSES